MKVVYIIGKYTDTTTVQINRNIKKAQIAGSKLAENGYCTIIPHTNFKAQELTIGYEGVMKECFELIKRSDIIYVLNNYKTSKGSKREIALAKELGKEVLYEED